MKSKETRHAAITGPDIKQVVNQLSEECWRTARELAGSHCGVHTGLAVVLSTAHASEEAGDLGRLGFRAET